jgi:Lon protease-like protein
MEREHAIHPSRARIPLFPLPDVVFFPRTYLPLHVFEHRYRQMVRDILDRHGRMAIALLKPGWRENYEGNPTIHPIVTVGHIQQYEPLDDGRYDVLLYGEYRALVLREYVSKPYREVVVEPIPEKPVDGRDGVELERSVLLALYDELLHVTGAQNTRSRLQAAELSFETLVNAVPSLLRIPAGERQRLLELDDLIERGRETRKLLAEAIRKASAP